MSACCSATVTFFCSCLWSNTFFLIFPHLANAEKNVTDSEIAFDLSHENKIYRLYGSDRSSSARLSYDDAKQRCTEVGGELAEVEPNNSTDINAMGSWLSKENVTGDSKTKVPPSAWVGNQERKSKKGLLETHCFIASS